MTDYSFDALLTSTTQPIVIDLWAAWCGPCRALAPTIEQLARDFAGRAIVGKCNVDDNPGTAQRCRASSIPLVAFFKGGREVDRVVGLGDPKDLARRLAALL